MKFFLFFSSIIFFNVFNAIAGPDSLLDELNKTINEVHIYDSKKINEIEVTRQSLSNAPTSDVNKLSLIYENLYNQYKLFNYDSAFLYGNKFLAIATTLNDSIKIANGKLNMSFILLSSGLFKETYDMLVSINIKPCSDFLKAEYYALFGRYYYDLETYDGDLNYSVSYDKQGNNYLDSAISFYVTNSFEYDYYKGLKFLKLGKNDSAFFYFKKLFSEANLTYHQTALVCSTISGIYLEAREEDKGIAMLAKAAIADIKSSNKETFAIFNLAELLYKKGDVKYASVFIENAIANANFYGARQRKAQVSSILPLIEEERIAATEKQNHDLIYYGIIATSLLASLIVLIFVIRKQIKKLEEAKKIITDSANRQQKINKVLDETIKQLEESNLKFANANHQLENANFQLAFSNKKLEEANHVKEECVSYFFNLDSEFFSKLEKLKSTLEKRVNEKSIEGIKSTVRKIDLKEEKEMLLQSFDKVFLRIYPNFIHSFNFFFKPEDQIEIPKNGTLNNDLRIFALIRLGISDINKIANITGYSVNTIYAYKSKIKNKSVLPNQEFEMKLMTIS